MLLTAETSLDHQPQYYCKHQPHRTLSMCHSRTVNPQSWHVNVSMARWPACQLASQHQPHYTRAAASIPPSSSSSSRSRSRRRRTHPVFWLRSVASEAAAGWCRPDPHPDAAARRRSGWCKTVRSSPWLAPPPPPESGPTALWPRSPHSSAAGWSPWRSGWYRTRRPLEAWLGFICLVCSVCWVSVYFQDSD